MTDHDRDGSGERPGEWTRRGLLACAPWTGTGLVWGLSGGVPFTLGLLGQAQAAQEAQEAQAVQPGGFTFVQISDSHIGFAKPVNPDPRGTLKAAVDRIGALPAKPSFMIHTGDITHLSKPQEFDDAAQIISEARLTTHYVPGEHDMLDPEMALFRERHGQGTKGAGWYCFDVAGVHFIGLINVNYSGRDTGVAYVDNPGAKAGGLGVLGEDQIAWIENDLRGRAASTPIVVFAHVPLWAAYPTWGWGTEESARVLSLLKRFGSVTVLNGHIHQVLQKVEGAVAFHTAMSTAFPRAAPGSQPKPDPKKVAAGQLRTVLGTTSVTFHQGQQRLALVDSPLKS